jgi:hypothetical protein
MVIPSALVYQEVSVADETATSQYDLGTGVSMPSRLYHRLWYTKKPPSPVRYQLQNTSVSVVPVSFHDNTISFIQ